MTLTTDATTPGPPTDADVDARTAEPTPSPLPLPRTGAEPSILPTGPSRLLDPDDVLDVDQLLGLSGRQADELAATTEHALAAEHAAHRAQLAELDDLRADLDRNHQRRVALLTLLAEHLGQINQQIDEAGHLTHR